MSNPKPIPRKEERMKMNKSVPIAIVREPKIEEQASESPSKSPQKLQASLYKTERCRSWQSTGNCKYGNKCQFAHGDDELRPVMRHPKYKTQVCKTYSRDKVCPYGTRCRFIHPGESSDPGNLLQSDSDFLGSSAPSPSSASSFFTLSPSSFQNFGPPNFSSFSIGTSPSPSSIHKADLLSSSPLSSVASFPQSLEERSTWPKKQKSSLEKGIKEASSFDDNEDTLFGFSSPKDFFFSSAVNNPHNGHISNKNSFSEEDREEKKRTKSIPLILNENNRHFLQTNIATVAFATSVPTQNHFASVNNTTSSSVDSKNSRLPFFASLAN